MGGSVPARSSRAAAGRLLPYLLLAPVFLLLLVFVFWPVLYSLFLSLRDWRIGYLTSSFVGLRNYARLLSSGKFLNSLHRTAVYATATTAVSMSAGLALALALRGMRRFAGPLQAAFFVPVASTMSAMAVVWRFVFHKELGILNSILLSVGLGEVPWLLDDTLAMASVVSVGVWNSFGYALILFSAGLAHIPASVLEAAEIDGATPAQRFLHVTAPMLSPTTLFVFVILTVRALESFDGVKVLTDGGPVRATQVLSHLLYEEAFQFFNTGSASAIAVVFFAITLLIARLQFVAEKGVHYR